MRVARFADGDDPRFGVVGAEDDVETIAVLKGDPLYAGFELTGQKIPLEQLRYWSAELQEAYASPAESLKRWQETR